MWKHFIQIHCCWNEANGLNLVNEFELSSFAEKKVACWKSERDTEETEPAARRWSADSVCLQLTLINRFKIFFEMRLSCA